MNRPEPMSEPAAPPPPAAPSAQLPASQLVATDPRIKSPAIACALSVMPGLGQVYVGYYQRGFFNALVFAGLISLLSAPVPGPLLPLGAIFLGFFWLYNLIDAARRASLYNQALSGGSDIELPADFKSPGFGGSIAGGLTFVGVGAVLLAHTRFGMSLDWIEDWWPAALILFGAYLVWKAVQDRASRETGSPDAD